MAFSQDDLQEHAIRYGDLGMQQSRAFRTCSGLGLAAYEGIGFDAMRCSSEVALPTEAQAMPNGFKGKILVAMHKGATLAAP